MKKLLAGLLFTALLAPDSAMATYSCFGTRSPCPFTTINATPLAAEPVKAEKVKKTKKKAKKKTAKKAVAKKKAPAKVYCEPAPSDLKADVKSAPANNMTPSPVEAAPVPTPVEAAPVPTPEPVPAPAPEKVITPPVDSTNTAPKTESLPQPEPEKKTDVTPEPGKGGSLLDTIKDIEPGKSAGGLPAAEALPDLKPAEAAPKPVPDTGFPEINAPSVPAPESVPSPDPSPLQAPAPTGALPSVDPMPAQPMKP